MLDSVLAVKLKRKLWPGSIYLRSFFWVSPTSSKFYLPRTGNPGLGTQDSLNYNDFVKQKVVVVSGFRDGSCCEIGVLEVVGAK